MSDTAEVSSGSGCETSLGQGGESGGELGLGQGGGGLAGLGQGGGEVGLGQGGGSLAGLGEGSGGALALLGQGSGGGLALLGQNVGGLAGFGQGGGGDIGLGQGGGDELGDVAVIGKDTEAENNGTRTGSPEEGAPPSVKRPRLSEEGLAVEVSAAPEQARQLLGNGAQGVVVVA